MLKCSETRGITSSSIAKCNIPTLPEAPPLPASLHFGGAHVRGYVGPRGLQGSTLDWFGRCQSITFHRFRMEICCIHEISYMSLCCTGNIIFFVIFTHSIHKFLPLSLIPPHKNHPARRSVRSTPGYFLYFIIQCYSACLIVQNLKMT